MSTTPETWMPEARQMAAQCWCYPETSHLTLDPALAEVVARAIANWMDDSARAHRDISYYRGLLVRCGVAIGPAAYIADDGSRSEDVLCAKVPELVEALTKTQDRARG